MSAIDQPPPQPQEPSAALPANPWLGLASYTEQDRNLFFGREREKAELLRLIERESLTVLFGRSGLGKTSLLRAGVIPALRETTYFPVILRLDYSGQGLDPIEQLKALLQEAAQANGIDVENVPPVDLKVTLWEFFHTVECWGPRNDQLTPILIFDQFEEVFTIGRNVNATSEFLDQLADLVENRAPRSLQDRIEQTKQPLSIDAGSRNYKIVLSLREDFVSKLDSLRPLMPAIMRNRLGLDPLDGQRALGVITNAGAEWVAEDVARDIVAAVAGRAQHGGSTLPAFALDAEIEPAYLSVMCHELFQRMLALRRNAITHDLVEQEHGGILEGLYERSFEGLDSKVRTFVEENLVSAGGFRMAVPLAEPIGEGLADKDLNTLVDRRLLRFEDRLGTRYVEVSHDLLTQVVQKSRDERRAREAAAVEAQQQVWLRRELRRSQKRNVVFVGVLIVAVLGFILAFYEERRRDEAAAKRNEADAESVRNWRMAAEATRSMGLDIGGDLWVPTGTTLRTIEKVEKGYSGLSSHIHDADDVKLQHAQFLAKAALALFEVGHFKEGIEDAGKALVLLDEIKQPKALPDAGLRRAEAFYAQGKGLLETGKLKDAKQDFTKALELAGPSAEDRSNRDGQRIYVLSQIGLGDVEKRALAFQAAAADYQQALEFINTKGLRGDESVSWKALALSGIGLSQSEDVKAENWLGKAIETLGGLRIIRQDNLRNKRLYAEVTYQDGFVEYRLDRLADAENLMRQSNTASEDLVKRDPENLDWQLSQAQGQRGSGIIHLSRGEWELSQQALERAEKTTAELISKQPDWTQAQFLRGAVFFSLGDIIRRKYFNSPSEWQDAKDLDRALEKYTEARKLLQESAQLSPKSLSLLAMAIAYQGLISEFRASIAGASPQVAEERRNTALALYAEARKVLQPIEQQEQADIALFAEWMADTLLNSKRFGAAISSYDEALKIRMEIVKKSPIPNNYSNLSKTHKSLGQAYLQNKDLSRASVEYDRAARAVNLALKLREEACARTHCPYTAADIELARQKADVQAAIYEQRSSQSDLPGAFDALEQAVTTVWDALQQDYANESLTGDLDRYRRVAEGKQKQLEEAQAKQKPEEARKKTGPSSTEGNATAQTGALLRRAKDLLARSDPKKLLRHNDLAGWAMPPMVPGAWRILSFNEFEAARKQLLAADKRFTADQIRGIRKLPVDFYDDAAIYEAEVLPESGKPGIISYIRRRKEITILDGLSDRIHEMNKKSPPRLDTTERATTYLRFFVGAIQSDDGRFMLVDQAQDLHWLPDAKAERRDEVEKEIKPLMIEALPDGRWQGIGTLQISNYLIVTSFQLSRVGYVRTKQFESVAKDLPIAVEGFLDEIRGPYTKEVAVERVRRQIEANPNNEDALRKLPGFYNDLKRWKEKADAQQQLVAFLERATKDEQQRRQKLPDAYAGLAWDRLWIGDFTAALVAAEAGEKVDGSSAVLQGYHADALLFLGRRKEAEPLYHQLEANSKWDTVLEGLVNLTSRHKRWEERADAQQKLVAFLERTTKDEQERRKKLPDAYANLAWDQLVAGDFAAALAAADAGKNLDDSSVLLDENRADALLFLGRTQEAEAIYRQLEAGSNWGETLTDLVTLYDHHHRWEERADAQQKLVAFLERTTKDEQERRKKLPDAYASLAWDQLVVGDFAAALAAADGGKKLDESNADLEEDQAHALKFLGRNQEADEIYRRLEAKAGFSDVLQHLVSLSSRHKRWKEAAEAQQRLVTFMLGEVKDGRERREKLPGEYTNLSWYHLLNRDFTAALASCDAGRKLAENHLPLQTNCAHALLFLGRVKEAEAIYLKYRGQKMFPDSDKTWEQTILQDFDDLQKGGLDHLEMARIRKLLGREQK